MTALSSTVLTGNRLLESLPRDEYERLQPNLQSVHLCRGRVLCEAGDFAQYVDFPLNGVVSLLSSTEAGEVIEVAMVGNEGTTALPVIMHTREMPYGAVIQVPVDALRSEREVIQKECKRGGQLQNLLVCYTHSVFTQIAQSAVCNRFHTAEQRFCRWLLCTHDRIQSDTVELTHEIISDMLGVQRSVVSVTAGAFQKRGLINYSRGSITILNRRGLETASCECYRIVKRQVTLCSSHCLNSVEPHSSG
ncbi:MAG TPA: Crp/Fnr family transcriptional regulator [Pyrinomonadaceae bacterium]|nr:Crp/Fnr family transcriptional regulator [Pyrinomonadaceae bacterium]